MVTTAKKIPKWQRISRTLAREIATTKTRVGEKFYSLSQISKNYKVSSITSRRVIDELAAQDLIEKRHGSGCFIKKHFSTLEIKFPIPRGHTFDSLRMGTIITLKMFEGLFCAIERFSCKLVPINFDLLREFNSRREYILMIWNMYSKAERDEICSWVRKHHHVAVCCHARKPIKGISTIRINTWKGAYDATRLLLARGHRRIAYLTQSTRSPILAPRFDGYYQALKDSDIFFDADLVKQVKHEDRSGHNKALRELLALPEKPTALLLCGYRHLDMVMYFLRSRRIKIPRDMALACFDNTYEMTITHPPVTAVDLLWSRTGEQAIAMLSEVAEAEEPQPRDLVLTPELVVRAST